MGVRFKRHGTSIYKTRRWAAVRKAAKRRDGWKCVECGARGRLEVDHVKPIRDRPDLAYDLNNVQVLCVPCHARKTRIEVGIVGPEDPEKERWKKLLGEALPKP